MIYLHYIYAFDALSVHHIYSVSLARIEYSRCALVFLDNAYNPLLHDLSQLSPHSSAPSAIMINHYDKEPVPTKCKRSLSFMRYLLAGSRAGISE